GGTQPAANEKISARFANKAKRFAAERVIAALIAGFAGTSQATHARLRARARVEQQKILFTRGPSGVCLLRLSPAYLSRQGWTNDDAHSSLTRRLRDGLCDSARGRHREPSS